MTTCKNCGHQFDLDFCNKYGQKTSVKLIEMKWLLHELPHAVWHVEKGFFFNIKKLCTRPGYAIRDFLEGKRKPFFNPLTYLAIMILVNYLVMLVVGFHTYYENESVSMTVDQALYWKEYDNTNWWIMEHAYWYILIAVPVISVFLFILFTLLRKKFNLAENAIIALFIIAQGALIQSIVYLLTGWIHSGILNRTMEKIDMFIIWPGFNAIALYQLYNPTRNKIFMAILMLLAVEIIMRLLWESAGWMSYLYHLIF